MKRNAIAGLCLATLMLAGAGLTNPASAQIPGANTTTNQVNSAPQPPLALDEHANWSDFGESPTPTFALSNVFGTYSDGDHDVASSASSSDNWSDFGESPAGTFSVSDADDTTTVGEAANPTTISSAVEDSVSLGTAASQAQENFLASASDAASTTAISDAVAAKLGSAGWSDFGESPPVERTSSAMMLDNGDDHDNWSDFGESPPEATR